MWLGSERRWERWSFSICFTDIRESQANPWASNHLLDEAPDWNWWSLGLDSNVTVRRLWRKKNWIDQKKVVFSYFVASCFVSFVPLDLIWSIWFLSLMRKKWEQRTETGPGEAISCTKALQVNKQLLEQTGACVYVCVALQFFLNFPHTYVTAVLSAPSLSLDILPLDRKLFPSLEWGSCLDAGSLHHAH